MCVSQCLFLSCISIHLYTLYNSAESHSSSFDYVSVPFCFLWSDYAWRRTSAPCLKASNAVAQTLLAGITQEQLYWTACSSCNSYTLLAIMSQKKKNPDVSLQQIFIYLFFWGDNALNLLFCNLCSRICVRSCVRSCVNNIKCYVNYLLLYVMLGIYMHHTSMQHNF